MASWGFIKPNSPLYNIFGFGAVPIESAVAGMPRKHGSPLCYWVLGNELDKKTALALAKVLYQKWRPECSSVVEAYNYIVLRGLPLGVNHFSAVSRSELNLD